MELFDIGAIDDAVRTLVAAFEAAEGLPSSDGFVAGTVLDPLITTP